MIRTWLQIVSELPWAIATEDKIDLAEARKILDRDHHDLDKVKRRIIEYLAVRKLKPDGGGAILCFLGPPGVGKTSLGKSIAEAMGRKFIRVALGGVRDEADIRGHRRTYIGSMPGRIIAELRKAGTRNPVMMLDEIDKLGADFRGDPAVGPARSARPRAEPHVHRSLPRRAVRPLARSSSSPPPTRWTPCPARCATAWKSSKSPATPRPTSSTSPSNTSSPASSKPTA